MSSPKLTELPQSKEVALDKDDPQSPEPSHIMEGEYAALMETNGKECESWYYFIRCEGNMDALNHLQEQLEKVDWYILDDLSTFDLDLEHFVSAKTAKEMTKLELNAYAFHRKFDGKLQKIDFNFKEKDLKKNAKLIGKVFDQLGYGQIEDYIDDEDLDPEDLTDTPQTDDESDSTSDTEDESDSSSSSEEETPKKKKNKGVPPSLIKQTLPRFAQKKRKS